MGGFEGLTEILPKIGLYQKILIFGGWIYVLLLSLEFLYYSIRLVFAGGKSKRKKRINS